MDDVSPSSTRNDHGSNGDTLINALVGAVVTVLLSFVPFSPVVGGTVAGYLEGRDGVRVGAISGLVAVIPLFLLVLLLVSLIGLFAADAATVVLILAMFGFAFLLLYTVALSALGGFLGVYLATEYV